MLNVAKFKEAEEVWRDNKGVLERGRRFKLMEREEVGGWSETRKYKLTYWTKADEWTGTGKGSDGVKVRFNKRESEFVARRFGLIV